MYVLSSTFNHDTVLIIFHGIYSVHRLCYLEKLKIKLKAMRKTGDPKFFRCYNHERHASQALLRHPH